MKILHLIDSGGLYGAEKMLLSLVAEQKVQGIDAMILSAGEPGIDSKPIEEEARRLHLAVTPWRMKPGFNVREALRIARWARAEGFDLLHSHGFKFNILLGMLPFNVRRLPIISTLHGYTEQSFKRKMGIYAFIDRLILRYSQAVVLVSEHMRNLKSLSHIPAARVHVIPNGISTHSVVSTDILNSEVSSFIKKNVFNFLVIGRLSKEKNINLAIEAVSRLRNEGHCLGLYIVGDGPEKHNLLALVEDRNLGSYVKFSGYLNDAESLMGFFDALLLPSLTEGLPIVVLEALRARLPVLASAVGGVPAILDHGESGYLFENDNLESLLQRIREVTTQPERLEVIKRTAYEKFLVRYSSVAMAQSYKKVYQGVLA